MQGKTTIQLFNAVTGKEEAKFEDKNIVTNALKDFLNKRVSCFNSNLRTGFPGTSNRYIYSLKGLVENFFSGLVLFGDTLTVDANKYHLDFVPELIGMANGDYSGGDKFRGDYNSTESGKAGNVWTQVWDFGTDKANGVIRTACLAPSFSALSAWGTEDGYQQQYLYPMSTPFDESTFRVGRTNMNTGSNSSDATIGKVNVSSEDYLYYVVSGKVFRMPIKLNDYNIDPIDNVNDSTEEIGNVPKSTSYYSMVVKDNQIYMIEYGNPSQISKVDPVTLAVTDTVVLSQNSSVVFNYNNFAGILGNVLYLLCSDNSIDKFNLTTGAFIENIDISADVVAQPYCMFNFDENILGMCDNNIISNVSNNRVYKYDGNRISLPIRWYYEANQLLPVDLTKFDDWQLFSNTTTMSSGLDMACLTTINVLGSPVTKLNTQTMKVTYQLTY